MIEVIVTRLSSAQVRLDWTSSDSSNVSWIFLDGALIGGPITGGTDRSFETNLSSDRTAQPEVHDVSSEPLSIWVEPNYYPVVHWTAGIEAVQYELQVDGVFYRRRKARQDEVFFSERIPRILTDGWHQFTVIAIDVAGNQDVSQDYWYRVWTPGSPVDSITVSAGSGAGLFDITLP